MKKRNLMAELAEGFDALAQQHAGKRTLRTHTVVRKRAPRITARGLFASYLRTNVRTLAKIGSRGARDPNVPAALLIRMVQRFPDTVSRLAEI